MAIGDINSNEVGSGARFNDGKIDIGLIPLYILADYYTITKGVTQCTQALTALGKFQRGGDRDDLIECLKALEFDWRTCAQVFEYGKKKYAEWNWAKGMPWSVPIACAGRHLMAVIEGEAFDAESKLPHIGHAECNIIMLLLYCDTYPEGDNRPVQWLNRRLAGEKFVGEHYDYDPYKYLISGGASA